MSEESLDYLKLCPNYYSNWEDGCCMENCTFNYLDECPIHYVKGLLAEKDKAIENWETMYKSVMQTCHNDKEEIKRLREQIALTEKALELACEECLSFPCSEYCGLQDECETCYYKEAYTPKNFKTKAREMMKSE